jgi:hypothetical protein
VRGRSLGTPKNVLVALDQSNPCVTRSRSQIPMPDPSIPSRKRSSRTGSSDAGCTMVVTFCLRCFCRPCGVKLHSAKSPIRAVARGISTAPVTLPAKIATCSIRGYCIAFASLYPSFGGIGSSRDRRLIAPARATKAPLPCWGAKIIDSLICLIIALQNRPTRPGSPISFGRDE